MTEGFVLRPLAVPENYAQVDTEFLESHDIRMGPGIAESLAFSELPHYSKLELNIIQSSDNRVPEVQVVQIRDTV